MTLWMLLVGALVVLSVIAIGSSVLVIALSRKMGLSGSPAPSEGDQQQALHVQLAVQAERLTRLAAAEQELVSANAALEEARAAHSKAEVDLAAAAQAHASLEDKIRDLQGAVNLAGERIESQTKSAADAANLSAGEISQLKSDLSALRETLAQERKQSDEKLKLLLDAKEVMAKEFNVLANDLMTKHGETFKKENKDQLDLLLTPLRDKLKEFQEGLQNAHTETGKDRAALAEQIKLLSEQSAKMTSETLNLTRALKGNTQAQGAWGEMILSSLLEKSGLREGEEYVVQTSHDTEDGKRLRPDVIVNLPNDQHVIIDAKVSLVAFEAYVNAEDEEVQRAALASHLASMRGHIKNLASKEYQGLRGGGLDYVIMFVPIEGALAAALQAEPGLTGFAAERNVAIATPITLMMALRTIDNLWKVERRNQNAEAIATRAGQLYDKFVGFVDDLQSIGKRLGQAQGAYSDALGKLQSGSGNLIGQAEKLKSLGAKAAKSLPKNLLSVEPAVAVLPDPDSITGGLDGASLEDLDGQLASAVEGRD
jgi:DNA recombination protein RmuC